MLSFKIEVIRLLELILKNQGVLDKKLDSILKQEIKMAGELDALTAQVAQNTNVEQSAITLIQGLSAQIAAAGTDPAKLSALTSQLNASATALAAAITANTPAGGNTNPPSSPSPTGT